MQVQPFQVFVTAENKTGRTLAAYFRVRKGRPKKVLEFAEGSAFAHYDHKGRLLGIELLGPCKVSVVDQIAINEEDKASRNRIKNFMRDNGPRKLVLT